MNARARERDAIARMRAVNPISIADLRASLGEDELREAMDASVLAGESRTVAAESRGRLRPAPKRRALRRRPFAAFASLACGAAIAFVVLLTGTPGGGSQPEFAGAMLKVAEANPRLLVPGWSIVYAGEFEADEGEVTFGDGRGHELSIWWNPAREYRQFLRDHNDVSPPETSVLLNHTATTLRYGPAEYATIISPIGSVFLEVRGALGSRSAYDAVLSSLREVGVSTWLEAMPADVVRPGDRPSEVAKLLRGVPIPPGFDAAALQGKDLVSDRYDLAVEVGDAVACGWVGSWLAAKEAGDAARAEEAVDAMASSQQWPLMEIIESGNIVGVAHELESGHLDTSAAGSLEWGPGEGYEMGPLWAMHIECKSHIWRRPLGSN
jgi:hypothetical protein